MGTTFNNLQIRTGDLARVREAALGLGLAPFAIARSGETWTTLCPRGMSFDGAAPAQRLSEQLDTVVLFFSCYDSDVFYYERYDAGERTDEYVSDPGQLEEDADSDAPSRGGDVERLHTLCPPSVSEDALTRLLRQRRVENLTDQELWSRQIAEPSVREEAVLREDLAKKLGEYLGIDADAAIMDHATAEAWEHVAG